VAVLSLRLRFSTIASAAIGPAIFPGKNIASPAQWIAPNGLRVCTPHHSGCEKNSNGSFILDASVARLS